VSQLPLIVFERLKTLKNLPWTETGTKGFCISFVSHNELPLIDVVCSVWEHEGLVLPESGHRGRTDTAGRAT